jgi:hypothetical protein
MKPELRYYRVSASSSIGASPATVYGIIADYRNHHPHIVPPEYFTGLEVLEGGVGAGTRTRVSMQVLGKKRVFEQVVTEPEPGCVLMETNADGSAVTTFTVGASGESESHLTIATILPLQPGLPGIVERLAVSLLFPRIYRKELTRLAEYVDRLQARAEALRAQPEAHGRLEPDMRR